MHTMKDEIVITRICLGIPKRPGIWRATHFRRGTIDGQGAVLAVKPITYLIMLMV